jgi:proline iminopeptidase
MAAKLIERQFHNVSGTSAGSISGDGKAWALIEFTGKLRVAELFFDVPVDYSKPNGITLRLFARSVARFNKPVEPTKDEGKLPWLVYLQGGPGFGCGAPQNYGWVEPALSKGYQVS